MKTLFRILTVVLAVCFFAAFFHHHEDGGLHQDCPVCRLVQALRGMALFALAIFLTAVLKTEKFFSVFQDRLSSLLLASSLKDRAPPVFSF